MLDEGFKEFVLEQLGRIENIEAKRMFGGAGIYCDGRFFGILAGESLYFKTNQDTRQRYIDLGMEAFRPSEKQMLKNYYQVPENVIDDSFELEDWARESISIA